MSSEFANISCQGVYLWLSLGAACISLMSVKLLHQSPKISSHHPLLDKLLLTWGYDFAGKIFAVGNAVDPTVNFYYNTGMSAQLLQSVMTKGEVGLVLGHRQAGKTTIAAQAVQEARSLGLEAHYVSLEQLTVKIQKSSQIICSLVVKKLT